MIATMPATASITQTVAPSKKSLLDDDSDDEDCKDFREGKVLGNKSEDGAANEDTAPAAATTTNSSTPQQQDVSSDSNNNSSTTRFPKISLSIKGLKKTSKFLKKMNFGIFIKILVESVKTI